MQFNYPDNYYPELTRELGWTSTTAINLLLRIGSDRLSSRIISNKQAPTQFLLTPRFIARQYKEFGPDEAKVRRLLRILVGYGLIKKTPYPRSRTSYLEFTDKALAFFCLFEQIKKNLNRIEHRYFRKFSKVWREVGSDLEKIKPHLEEKKTLATEETQAFQAPPNVNSVNNECELSEHYLYKYYFLNKNNKKLPKKKTENRTASHLINYSQSDNQLLASYCLPFDWQPTKTQANPNEYQQTDNPNPMANKNTSNSNPPAHLDHVDSSGVQAHDKSVAPPRGPENASELKRINSPVPLKDLAHLKLSSKLRAQIKTSRRQGLAQLTPKREAAILRTYNRLLPDWQQVSIQRWGHHSSRAQLYRSWYENIQNSPEIASAEFFYYLFLDASENEFFTKQLESGDRPAWMKLEYFFRPTKFAQKVDDVLDSYDYSEWKVMS